MTTEHQHGNFYHQVRSKQLCVDRSIITICGICADDKCVTFRQVLFQVLFPTERLGLSRAYGYMYAGCVRGLREGAATAD